MSPIRTGALGGLLLVSVIGLIDSGRDSQWDLFVLFGLASLLTLTLLPAVVGGRRPVRLRADLWRWLAQRSDITGEPQEAIADRAVARHRDALEPEPAERDDGG